MPELLNINSHTSGKKEPFISAAGNINFNVAIDAVSNSTITDLGKTLGSLIQISSRTRMNVALDFLVRKA